MNWFLVAIMAMIYDGGTKDIYIWHTPMFESSQQCSKHVEENNDLIHFHLKKEFPNDSMERLMCVPEDKLKEFLKAYQEGVQVL
tara:strand:- start:6977 stop:7228 length:252 start_codon:yes stop_codon:yes gene_type:complete